MIVTRFLSTKNTRVSFQSHPEALLNDIKSSLASQINVSVDQIIVFLKGKILKDNCSLATLNYDPNKDTFLFYINNGKSAYQYSSSHSSTSSQYQKPIYSQPIVFSQLPQSLQNQVRQQSPSSHINVLQPPPSDSLQSTKTNASSHPNLQLQFSQPSSSSTLSTSHPVDESAVNSLVEMGFARDSVINALRRANGNPDRAYSILNYESQFNQSDVERLMTFGFQREFVLNLLEMNNGNFDDVYQTLQSMLAIKNDLNQDPSRLSSLVERMKKVSPKAGQFLISHPQRFLQVLGLDPSRFDLSAITRDAPSSVTAEQSETSSKIDVNSRKFQDAITDLIEIGFERENIISALIAAGGNKQEAIEILISQS